MSIAPQTETLALNSLHDISEYTSYLDRRILKLNLLYQSLDIKKNLPTQQHSRPSKAQMKLYSTAKEAFEYSRKPTPPVLDSFYATQYHRKRQANKRIIQNTRPYSELKSDFNNFDKSRQFLATLKSRKASPSSDKNQQRLKLYQSVKKQMLGTFYVGAGKSLESKKSRYPALRYSQGEDSHKIKKGKLWHGRPPVKIVQKFD